MGSTRQLFLKLREFSCGISFSFGKCYFWQKYTELSFNSKQGCNILALNEIYIVSKTILYLNTDADAVNAQMLMPRFPRGPLHVDELKFSLSRNFILRWNYFRLHWHFNPRWEQEYFIRPCWTQKHHLQYVYTSWYINENCCYIKVVRF